MTCAKWEMAALCLQSHVRHNLETVRKKGHRNFIRQWGQSHRNPASLVLANFISYPEALSGLQIGPHVVFLHTSGNNHFQITEWCHVTRTPMCWFWSCHSIASRPWRSLLISFDPRFVPPYAKELKQKCLWKLFFL